MNIVENHVSALGWRVRDKITGLEGIVESVSFDLYGCVQAVIRPTVKDNKPEDARWVDIQRLEVINTDRIMPLPDFAALANAAGEHEKGPSDKPGSCPGARRG